MVDVLNMCIIICELFVEQLYYDVLNTVLRSSRACINPFFHIIFTFPALGATSPCQDSAMNVQQHGCEKNEITRTLGLS
jgi:hypothetical protein